VGHAEVDERAVVAAALLVVCRRSGLDLEKFSCSGDGFQSEGAKVFVDGERRPASGFPVENQALGDGGLKHLLQTKRLRTDLHLIRPMQLRLPPFILNGRQRPIAIPLHNIADPAQIVLP